MKTVALYNARGVVAPCFSFLFVLLATVAEWSFIMNDAMEYENFMKVAFRVQRCSDYAQMADASVFDCQPIEVIKVAVQYAMGYYSERLTGQISEEFLQRMLSAVRNAENKTEIIQTIRLFQKQVS